ncbi:MAG: 50S ribosomal protein L4 [Candidatus Cloacimonetes bacterium]|nr:50S ribosomal protein L4 [Candidatus Cloacimonadota bacterium]MCF7814359.1 50S ribosomal protein L4 [Candidatus Cloacimonadota bacterium]MCF7868949.1 50S ribosomal protein L4 [Candidatus Cloacimonadota bacterium]MCF7884343.1 50S ribosomal protein L4 [Candidatus Cloacimonadota bacterium]
MLKVNKFSMQGEEVGKITLPKSLFAAESKNPSAVLYEVVNMYLGNQRQGTSEVQTRAEAHGSGKKLFRQKGTGNARPGNLRTPLRVGGGRAFGPKTKDWYKPIPKKKKNLALKLALTKKAEAKQVVVVESLDFEKANTKMAKNLLDKITPEKSKKLLLIENSDRNIINSFNNIPFVNMDRADCAYAYEVLNCSCLVITEKALKKLEEVFA